MSDVTRPPGAPKRAEPRSFRARALSASLTVKDLEASLAWYRDVVGFHVDDTHEYEGTVVAASLAAGAVRLILNQDDGARGWDRVKGEGFSLYVTTAQDVDLLATRIEERGGTLASRPSDRPWGARVFNLVDPDGFKLAIASEG